MGKRNGPQIETRDEGIDGTMSASFPPRLSFATPVMLVTSPTVSWANAAARWQVRVEAEYSDGDMPNRWMHLLPA